MSSKTFAPSFSRFAFRLALLSSTIVVGTAVPIAAQAQTASAETAQAASGRGVRFNVPAQELDSALTSIADQGGIRIFFPSAELRGVRTNGLSGSMTVEQALSQILTGTGFGWRYREAGTVVVERLPRASDGAIQLGPVRVEGATGQSATTSGDIGPTLTEGSSSYTTPAVEIGGRTARSLREIPQAVSVMTAQRLRDQGITTSEDALRQATGITVNDASSFYTETFTSRGMGLTIQTDGGTPGVNGFWFATGVPDLAMYDHVEVLRGADGLFNGWGDAGGTVNLVRKRPLDHNQMVAELTAGSWDRYRGQVDLTGPIAWDGRIRARFVAAIEDRDYFYKPGHQDKNVFYGVVEADLSPTTLLTVGGSYERRNTQGVYFGHPRYLTGEDLGLAREDCLCTDWSYRNYRTKEIFARLEQAIGNDWKLKLNASRQRLEYEYLFGYVRGGVNPVSGTGAQLYQEFSEVSNTTKVLDGNLTGSFSVLGVKNELVVGASYQDMFSMGNGSTITPFPAVNAQGFHQDDYAEPTLPASYIGIIPFGGQKQFGAYASIKTHITDSLRTIFGVRYSKYKYIYARSAIYEEGDAWTPFFSASLDVSRNISLYASYTSIFTPNNGYISAAGELLDPVEGNTYEVGAKGEWLDGRLNASLAVYRTRRKNERVLDFARAGNPPCCYIANAVTQSQGVDFEIAGEVLPGWEISFGYTYNDNELKSGRGALNGTRFSTTTPDHLLKFWTMARMPGSLSRLRLGGGVNAQSSNYVSGSASIIDSLGVITGTSTYEFTQKAYAVVGLSAEYEVNDHITAHVNLNNLFDKKYYRTVGSARQGNFYGDPRSILATVRVTF